MFFSNKKEKKLKAFLSIMFAQMGQDEDLSEEETGWALITLQKYSERLNFRMSKSAIKESFEVNNTQIADAFTELRKLKFEEKLEFIDDLVKLSIVDGELTMSELYAIYMCAELMGGINRDPLINAILEDEDLIKAFGDLKPKFQQFLERVGEIGLVEARDEENAIRKGEKKPNKANPKKTGTNGKYCPECGIEAKSEAKYCTNCGSKL